MGNSSKRPYNLHRKREKSNLFLEITETRECPLFRATGERGYEVARGRKARQIAPKTRNSAFLENTTGSKKPTSKRSHKVLLEYQWLMARGRTPPNRQSFRGCPNVISFCLLMGCKGDLTGLAGVCQFHCA